MKTSQHRVIIKSFSNDFIGSKIKVVEIVREHRVEKDQINEIEKTIHNQMYLEEAHEQCQVMLDNVAQMREWMEKNYYTIYYNDEISV